MGRTDKKKENVGRKMDFRGDFNDIKSQNEKKGGRVMNVNSFANFRDFIAKMKMREIRFKGEEFTWANNREGEGFI